MTTGGIEAVFVETHNWGKSAKFFQELGYQIEFATDHNSGQLRRGEGPYLFIAEVPETAPTRRHVVLGVADADAFELDASIAVVDGWAPTAKQLAVYRDVFRRRPRSEWLDAFHTGDVPAGAVEPLALGSCATTWSGPLKPSPKPFASSA